MSQAASPAQTLPIAGSDETALIRVDGQRGAREGYRRMPRSDARLNEDSVADATTDTVAIDAPRNAWQARRPAVLSRPAAPASAAADPIVAPHQTYALMSAGLLSMALVVVRRRRR